MYFLLWIPDWKDKNFFCWFGDKLLSFPFCCCWCILIFCCCCRWVWVCLTSFNVIAIANTYKIVVKENEHKNRIVLFLNKSHSFGIQDETLWSSQNFNGFCHSDEFSGILNANETPWHCKNYFNMQLVDATNIEHTKWMKTIG